MLWEHASSPMEGPCWFPASSCVSEPSQKQILQLWSTFQMPRSASWLRTHERFLVRTSWSSCSWIPDTPKSVCNNKCLLFWTTSFWDNLLPRNRSLMHCLVCVICGTWTRRSKPTDNRACKVWKGAARCPGLKLPFRELSFSHSSVAAPSPLNSVDIFLGFFFFYLIFIFLTPDYIPSDPFSSWSCQVWPEDVHVADVLHVSFY